MLFKIIKNSTIRKLGYDFLIAFHSNCSRHPSHDGIGRAAKNSINYTTPSMQCSNTCKPTCCTVRSSVETAHFFYRYDAKAYCQRRSAKAQRGKRACSLSKVKVKVWTLAIAPLT